MKFKIIHALPGRLSVAIEEPLGNPVDYLVERSLRRVAGVRRITFHRHARRLAVGYEDGEDTRTGIVAALSQLDLRGASNAKAYERPMPATPPRTLTKATLAFLASQVLSGPLRILVALYGAYPYLKSGLASLTESRLDASALDATAITTALVSRNYSTAGLISYLLSLGNHIERLTQRWTEDKLASLLESGRSTVWVVREGSERKIDKEDLRAGDTVVLRTGDLVPADGEVTEGEALVNQSVVTGEVWSQPRSKGSAVYEGAAVAEGKLLVSVSQAGDQTKLAQMIRIIKAAKDKKAGFESYAERLADSTVPYVLSGAGLSYLFSGDPLRASSALLVDYSCALRLIIPIVFRTGLIEAGNGDILVKGTKWLERLSRVDAIAFDKSGTLTKGWPRVVKVLPLNGYSRKYLLRNLACVEEHFTHPIATAIVEAADRAGYDHVIETHGELDYLISRGIITSVEGKRFVVGGERMLKTYDIDISACLPQIRSMKRAGYSLIFVAVEQKLAGVIALDDPVRGETLRTISRLKKLGIREIIMLTGDSREVARRIAGELGIDEYHAEVFPEEKVAILEQLKRKGRTVAMVGDGLNDGPALSCADVGISLSSGSDLGREAADTVLLTPRLDLIPEAVELSRATIVRAHRNLRYILGINTSLIAMGMLGLLSPTRSAFFHNISTVLLSLNALQRTGRDRARWPGQRTQTDKRLAVSPLRQ